MSAHVAKLCEAEIRLAVPVLLGSQLLRDLFVLRDRLGVFHFQNETRWNVDALTTVATAGDAYAYAYAYVCITGEASRNGS